MVSRGFEEDQLNVFLHVPCIFSPEDSIRIGASIYLDELYSALNPFTKDQIPGLDGCPLEFHLAFLGLVGQYLLVLVEGA